MSMVTDARDPVDPQFPRTPAYRGAPKSAHDGLAAEIYLALDQLDMLAEHTVSRTGADGVVVWCVDEVWPE